MPWEIPYIITMARAHDTLSSHPHMAPGIAFPFVFDISQTSVTRRQFAGTQAIRGLAVHTPREQQHQEGAEGQARSPQAPFMISNLSRKARAVLVRGPGAPACAFVQAGTWWRDSFKPSWNSSKVKCSERPSSRGLCPSVVLLHVRLCACLPQ